MIMSLLILTCCHCFKIFSEKKRSSAGGNRDIYFLCIDARDLNTNYATTYGMINLFWYFLGPQS